MSATLRQYMAGMTALVAVVGLACPGCQQQPEMTPEVVGESEPNGNFALAPRVALKSNESALVMGTVADSSDVDVFDIGEVSAGDRVIATLMRLSTSLRSSIALYDDEGELIFEDTLTTVEDPSADPSIAHVVRADSSHLYVAVSRNFATATTGDYEVSVKVERGGSPPAPTRQTVVLNFAGGVVDNPLAGTVTLDPFDAGDIHPIYDGETDTMKAVIKQVVAQNYERFEIKLLNTDDDAIPDGTVAARINFGGFSSVAFGVADGVDLYNSRLNDSAIIFTESFGPNNFLTVPTAEELAIGVGNVASHELGHLLGMHHVRDPHALMDEASPAFTLLFDQEFMSAPLSPTVFPLGAQDSSDLLLVILGPAASAKPLIDPKVLKMLHGGGSLELDTTNGHVPPAVCWNCLVRQQLAHAAP